MQLTPGELRVMGYIAMGLGAYHLCVTNRERSTRDRIVRRLVLRRMISGGIGQPWGLTDEGRARYEQRGQQTG